MEKTKTAQTRYDCTPTPPDAQVAVIKRNHRHRDFCKTLRRAEIMRLTSPGQTPHSVHLGWPQWRGYLGVTRGAKLITGSWTDPHRTIFDGTGTM